MSTRGEGIRIGINPIGWSNDDLPALGGDTPLEVALRAGAEIGYEGFELNGKFPQDAAAIGEVLARHGLRLVSGWYSGALARRSVEEEIAAIEPQVRRLVDNGAQCLVYGEAADSIQGRPVALCERPRWHSQAAWRRYAEKLDRLGAFLAARGLKLAYHPHAGAYVESAEDIDRLMALTGPDVGLLFDSGHCALGGADPCAVLERHLHRVCHVHLKDVRREVMRMARNAQWSFPDCILNGVFTVPGDGDLDFQSLIEALVGHGYRGWLVVEAEQDPAVAPSEAYARAGYEAVRRMLTTARRRAGGEAP